ncbi:MAG TPA: Gfo/Idh/MocA family oxidoreductase [Gemmataceae bacterium]|nr:Gfo/Idh/MocA family oxidoreductase [Gemmataceae bacterium]
MSRLRMAVIGVGHLGKEHARILAGLPDVELVGVADVNLDQAKAIASRFNTQAFADYWPLLNLAEAASIVVPTTYHHAVASEFLRRGLHVLIEKPLALDVQQCDSLVEIGQRYNALIQVGHIERFNPAFEDLMQRRLQPKVVNCERFGVFTGRSTDIGVVLDLMIHDLDLLLALVKSKVVDVQAVGLSVFGKHEDIGQAWLRFENGCMATVSVSRASVMPSRSMEVWSPEGFARVDFSTRKLTLLQPSDDVRQNGLDPRRLDAASLATLKDELFTRHLQVLELDRNQGDQLTRELQHFVNCVSTGQTPRVSGTDGSEAIALAHRILDCMRAHRWDGSAEGPVGPTHLPAPLGPLFTPGEVRAVA